MLSIAKHTLLKQQRVLKPNSLTFSSSRASTSRFGLHLKQQTSFSTHQRLFQEAAKQPQSVPLSKLSESFLNGTNSIYVEQMFEAWQRDPNSVHSSWNAFFSNVQSGMAPGQAFSFPASFLPAGTTPSMTSSTGGGDLNKVITESMRVLLLVRAYQVRGHVMAKIDPLHMTSHSTPPELQLESYGFSEADLDREFLIGDHILSGFLSKDRPQAKLRDLIKRLQETYCGAIGFEYMHIQDREKCNWLRERIETPHQVKKSTSDLLVILDRLAWATEFELFLAKKWGVTKRFGVDGAESLIPGIKAMIDKLSESGVENIVMGMPHRGRLNVLANVVRKPLEAIFHEFAGGSSMGTEEFYTGSGDVKYHLGTSYDRKTRSGKTIHLSLLANPSHLEAVDPVVEGKARAKQTILKDHKHEKVASLLLHGDASFAAQGIVYETVGFSGLENYTTGGSIHVIVNNQIGFTTDPRSSRGSIYCTDLAKAMDAPVFHVNGDDPEAVVHVMELAAEWRQTFHRDVVVDIVCYRRYGHNEGDEPRFTQPMMYKQIDKTPPAFQLYSGKLLKEGAVTQQQIDEILQNVRNTLEQKFKESSQYVPKPSEWFDSVWKGFKGATQLERIKNLPISKEILQKVGKSLYSLPPNFVLHPNVQRLINGRKQMIETGKNVDWGTAEALAVGSLLLEGNHVRISGQDCERGTFSHRHAVLHDQNTGSTHVPLSNLDADQALFTVTNSSLSEFGVLGFELGYSLENPNFLVMWEAQFGDFANGAQVMIDQFVSAGEAKWRRQSSLVMLLPHGYDGSGPEHSSARLERYLQMSDSDPDVIPQGNPEQVIQLSNWQVANITTPANFFYALRRQIHRDFRKPLVVVSPKSLLKHRLAVSDLSEFTNGTFQRLIPETSTNLVADNKIEKVLFCSGKVYYELLEEREKRKINNIAIVRIEQLYPFPFDLVAEQGAKYPKAQIVWAQEEHKNMGAWSWIAPHMRTALVKSRGNAFYPTYVGRGSAASPATGFSFEHKKQLQELMDKAFAPAK